MSRLPTYKRGSSEIGHSLCWTQCCTCRRTKRVWVDEAFYEANKDKSKVIFYCVKCKKDIEHHFSGVEKKII